LELKLSQQIYIYKEELAGRPEVLKHVGKMKEKNPSLTVLDIGATHNPFSLEFLTHTFDFRPAEIPGVTAFSGDINQYEDWVQLFNYVEIHGKFDFVNCTHTLEDVAYPMAALRYMPKIAKEGFIAVPSKYYELQRRDSFRGGIHHRWIFDSRDGKLVAYPKISLIETLTWFPHGLKIEEQANTELRLFWKDNIDFEIINNDYLGPTREAVIEMYQNLIP
jgi:hypothetical protein